DHIRVNGGNIFVDNAISDAIHAKDKFVMDKGSLNLTATSDGIDCKNGYVVINNGSIEMNVGGKGIKSEKDTEALPEKQAINYFTYINNGTINIKAGDEGIDSKQSLTINGGEISISANENALNSQERLSINGGSIYCYSKNSDGVDSNADIIITNGTIISYGSNAEKSGFDCNENKFIIKGGYVIGAGFKTSVPTEESTNNSIIVKGISQVLTCISNNSNNILVFEPEYSFTTLLISTPDIKTNTSYNIYQGGTMSGEAEAKYGLYLSGVYNNDGATTKEISTSNSWITTIE
ncbi:MAG: carbohydrate-binding domain-containing protein, partial [Paludibacteraceae bacterium]|nr:carbohydrate-binding domain-containing protein [Paludibacteraceae bacterium]